MENIYFIGINGIGMSGLAKIMKSKGKNVFGSDITKNYVTEELNSIGIKVYEEHNKENIIKNNIDTVVISSAIKKGNPEYDYALENNLKIIKRGELLAHLLNQEEGIAVAGTHGKTTTSSMLASVMLPKEPTIVVGGILPEISSNAKVGTSKYFIAEADESDNSFLYMLPKYSIITNIEADHLENHGSLENIINSFSEFIDKTEKEILVCSDCKIIEALIKDKKDKTVVRYSIEKEDVDIYAKNIRIKGEKTEFEVVIKGEKIGVFSLSIPGGHNVSNSLPVIYLAHKFGMSPEEIRENLVKFRGSKRRYDVLYNDGNIKIIDDYAHHPTEINATLQGAKSIEKNEITVVFQPHRYSRVKFLLKDFGKCFELANKVVLLPIYSAGEKDEFGVTIEDLRDEIQKEDVRIFTEIDDVEKMVTSEEKRVFIFMGAGDISKMAHNIVDRLEGKL